MAGFANNRSTLRLFGPNTPILSDKPVWPSGSGPWHAGFYSEHGRLLSGASGSVGAGPGIPDSAWSRSPPSLSDACLAPLIRSPVLRGPAFRPPVLRSPLLPCPGLRSPLHGSPVLGWVPPFALRSFGPAKKFHCALAFGLRSGGLRAHGLQILGSRCLGARALALSPLGLRALARADPSQSGLCLPRHSVSAPLLVLSFAVRPFQAAWKARRPVGRFDRKPK